VLHNICYICSGDLPDMSALVHNRMSILHLWRFAYYIWRLIKCISYKTILLAFVLINANAWTYRLQHAYNVHNFYTKTIWYSCLLGDNHKFIANVMDKDRKMHYFCLVYTFECCIQHPNVATFEGSFECRAFVYALVCTRT